MAINPLGNKPGKKKHTAFKLKVQLGQFYVNPFWNQQVTETIGFFFHFEGYTTMPMVIFRAWPTCAS